MLFAYFHICIFACAVFFNAMSLCSLTLRAVLARLSGLTYGHPLLTSTVLCKSPKLRLAPPKLPGPQVHFVHFASLPASGVQGVGLICDVMWEFANLVH